jgi:Xaa-Pro aminopeptidase
LAAADKRPPNVPGIDAPHGLQRMTRAALRRDKLRKRLGDLQLDGLLISSAVNVSYLTGFTGEDSFLLLTRQRDILLSDRRFTTQLRDECPDIEHLIRGPATSMMQLVARAVRSARLRRVGFESSSISVAQHAELVAPSKTTTWCSTSGLVEELRIVKDADEIACLRHAARLAEKAFTVVRARLHAEQTERQVAAELEYVIRGLGGDGCSFPSIVAVGQRAALPHARPTDRKVGSAPSVLLDWGAVYGGYRSDLTRVLVTARIPPKLERVYRVVLNAQECAIRAIRPGIACRKVDEIARSVIAEAGYGRFFGHSLGHGLGLQVHEAPRLGPKRDEPLRPGMVVTVEPGIYLPGQFGVRIEDDVLVTRSGCEVLTQVPKRWEDAQVT